VAHVEEGPQQLGRKDSFEYLSVFFQGADVPEESEEEHSELIEGLWLVLFLDVVELDHVTVGRVRPHQQPDSLVEALLDVLAGDVVVEHQMCQYLDVVDHLFVVKGVPQLEADQAAEVVCLEVVNRLGLGGQEQLVDAAQQRHLQEKVCLVALELVD
jgi:hypothetical protein